MTNSDEALPEAPQSDKQQNPAAADHEVTSPTDFGGVLLEVVEDLLASQRTVLRLAEYVDVRQAEIDNRRNLALEFARREYSDVPEEVVDGLIVVMDNIAATVESTLDEPESATVDRLPVLIETAMSEVPENYRSPTFFQAVARAQAQGPSTPLLLSSLLTTLVGDFEVLIGSLARAVIGRHPGALDTSERSFTWKEISAHATLQDLQEHVIERAVEDLLRESSEGWMKFFESKYKIAIPPMARSSEALEVFQRRHVVVHNGGRVSRQYLENLPALKSPPEIGEQLLVDEEYLRHAADVLCSVGINLVHNTARRMMKKDELRRADNKMANIPYRLLQDRRYFVTKTLTEDQPFHTFEDDYVKLVMRVNGWLAQKRLGDFEACRQEVVEWQANALRPVFQLAKFALLDDLERGHALVLRIRDTPELSLAFWLTWPLLSELREYERKISAPAAAEPKP